MPSVHPEIEQTQSQPFGEDIIRMGRSQIDYSA
jgi:hypothetical protein